jgi:hypothetical protein
MVKSIESFTGITFAPNQIFYNKKTHICNFIKLNRGKHLGSFFRHRNHQSISKIPFFLSITPIIHLYGGKDKHCVT